VAVRHADDAPDTYVHADTQVYIGRIHAVPSGLRRPLFVTSTCRSSAADLAQFPTRMTGTRYTSAVFIDR